jgi:hypothetical protein
MTRSESMDLALPENAAMTQKERSQLRRRCFWNVVGAGIFIVIWAVAVVAILLGSTAPPIVTFGLVLFLTVGIGFRAYPFSKRAYDIWQDVRSGQVGFDVGTVSPQAFGVGRNVKFMLVVDSDRRYFFLDSVLPGLQKDKRYCLRIAPHSGVVVNAILVSESD